jgi:glycosyltransferase involved in cell wall biosynthesis
MIVKNETKVIRHCLESALPLVDYILVVDTGSTDGTQEMVRDFLAHHNIEGAVVEEAWRDFAYNRSFALARLREVVKIDYALVIDADDTLELDVGFDPLTFKSRMTHDLYDVPVRHGSMTHHRPQLLSNRLPFLFKGVLHEYVEAPPGNLTRTAIKGFAIHASSGGGSRSDNPKKYPDDAAVLERALRNETDQFLISRYTFYLAQSYRDCGEHEKALTNYVKRSELGYWNEEVYISLLEAGHLKSALERPFDEVIDIYLAASKVVPHRAESLHAASRFCRLKGKFTEGYEFAKQGLQIFRPETGLFIQSWVYDYGLLDELAVNAYWCGRYMDCYNACLKVLADERAPVDQRGRIQDNADFALEKLKELTSSLGESPVIELPSRRDLPSFNICLVSIDRHFPIFEQIIQALQGALNDLNYFCSVKHNALEKGAINIVIGSTAFAARDPTRLEYLEHPPFIIYQMEQLGDQPFLDARKEYFSLLEKASHILEYSPSQLGLLRSTFGSKTSLLPASFYRSLEIFRPKEVRDIDVLFYASHTPRRDQALVALAAEGVNVKHLYSVYGQVLYDYIRRSKIVLNVHAWPNLNPLETFRLSFLLANRCFVISEPGDHNPYGNGVIFSSYEDLGRCCLAYLKAPEVRDAVAAEGYLAVRRSDLVSDLSGILKRLPLNEFIYRE